MLKAETSQAIADDSNHWPKRIGGEVVLLGVVRLPFFNEFGEPLAGTERLLLTFWTERARVYRRHEPTQDRSCVLLRVRIDRLPRPPGEADVSTPILAPPWAIAFRQLACP